MLGDFCMYEKYLGYILLHHRVRHTCACVGELKRKLDALEYKFHPTISNANDNSFFIF